MVLQVEVSMEEWYKQKAIGAAFDSYSSLERVFFFPNRTNRSGIIDKAGSIEGFVSYIFALLYYGKGLSLYTNFY